MMHHIHLNDEQVRSLIRLGHIKFAGWNGSGQKNKIFGHLNCPSGKKKIKRENRVFFENLQDAISQGFRPCACCMNKAYQTWKHSIRQ